MPKNKNNKKRKHSNSSAELTSVCNITGLTDTNGQYDNLLDCLEELESAQILSYVQPNQQQDVAAKASESKTKSANQAPTTPAASSINHAPNIKIELSRHLQIETLSTFLLTSCKGLRMPSFERWLLDSKLEERERHETILTQWEEDPSLKQFSKKKYGRAAFYNDLAKQKEDRRRERDIRLLSSVDKFSFHKSKWEVIRSVDVDSILPSEPLESDPSSLRLLAEVVAVLAANSSEDDVSQKGEEIVKELCTRTQEVVVNLSHMTTRLGKYHKFQRESGKQKKREKASGVDKVSIEWNSGKSICSLVYTPKKKRSDSSAGNEGYDTTTKHKPKPFIVKLNTEHYHKLLSIFDKTYSLPNTDDDMKELTKSQVTHIFHSIIFSMIIRYSSLAGGQQLNDLRGGGMQGAIHNEVFDCFTKWFGKLGVECFASPFNCRLSRYYSMFSSPDIDGYFGSCGDFFYSSRENFLHDGCWYELNPPFSPGIMNKMSERIIELLELASKRNMNVTFVVIVPTCEAKNKSSSCRKEVKKSKQGSQHDNKSEEAGSKSNANPVSSIVHQFASTSFNRLVNDSRCILHTILHAREHGYVEGSQHLRPTKYKESKYSTSVIVLQSDRGPRKAGNITWDAKSFEKDLRDVFASRHKLELQARRGDDGSAK